MRTRTQALMHDQMHVDNTHMHMHSFMCVHQRHFETNNFTCDSVTQLALYTWRPFLISLLSVLSSVLPSALKVE